MSGEINLYGVFIPSLLVWMLVALVILLSVRSLLTRMHFYRLVWHRSLFNLSLYLIALGGVVYLTHLQSL
ncbi:Tetrapartite efflux system component, FusD-like (plasmid) [Cupriavidus necator H850]|uniref:DUF1656 domain-containing protein n=1 Tax=Cupriavidus necator TaxID=106590 RepID=UPI00129DD6EB|nr:DUF1656 domain-containing protein [Cupriavidus necator]KAI3605927.1 Tetrapartite efflux system component, FusD-like [Cupriavidus necator H850]